MTDRLAWWRREWVAAALLAWVVASGVAAMGNLISNQESAEELALPRRVRGRLASWEGLTGFLDGFDAEAASRGEAAATPSYRKGRNLGQGLTLALLVAAAFASLRAFVPARPLARPERLVIAALLSLLAARHLCSAALTPWRLGPHETGAGLWFACAMLSLGLGAAACAAILWAGGFGATTSGEAAARMRTTELSRSDPA